MKKLLLTSLTVLTAITLFAQSQGPNSAGLGFCNSSCLACPGSVWNTPTNIYAQDNALATVTIMPNGNCFQSTCFYTRYLYASHFGFTIPGTATITGIVAEIYRFSGNTGSATDSTVRLGKTNLNPIGANRADPNPWSLTPAYYTYGNSSDMWGATWTPAEINSVDFGSWLKIYNMSTGATTPALDHIRLTVYYSTSTGTYSQTSSPSTFNTFQNENELNVAFTSSEQIAKGSLKVYNMMGELQMKKELSNVPAGMSTEKFSLNDLAPGIYFVQLDNGSSIQTKKVFIHD